MSWLQSMAAGWLAGNVAPRGLPFPSTPGHRPDDVCSDGLSGLAEAAALYRAIGSHASFSEDFQISSGGQVVYRADQEDADTVELYSVPLAGGTPVKLNDQQFLYSRVSSFDISPNGERVVYLSSHGSWRVYELYSVPLTGPAKAGVKLNEPLPALGAVYSTRNPYPQPLAALVSRAVYLPPSLSHSPGETPLELGQIHGILWPKG